MVCSLLVTLNTGMEYGFDLYNLGRIFMTGEGTQKNHKYDLRREGMSYDIGKLRELR